MACAVSHCCKQPKFAIWPPLEGLLLHCVYKCAASTGPVLHDTLLTTLSIASTQSKRTSKLI